MASGGWQAPALMKPWRGDALVAYEVDRRVNSPGSNDPSCVEPVRLGVI
jgi:putative SOS response-associated peptidase YedK